MLELLKELASIENFSGEEENIIKYITPKLKALNFKFRVDDLGNITARRGKADSYVLLNAHMDSVKGYGTSWYDEDRYSSHHYRAKSYDCKDCIYQPMCNYEREFKNWCKYFEESEESLAKIEVKTPKKTAKKEFALLYNEKTNELKSNGTRPIGGDDKCGIAIALKIAEELPNLPLKILFTVQEEVGCVGVKHVVETRKDFFKNVAYSLTIDRKGSNNICVTSAGGQNASKYFVAELAKYGILQGIPIELVSGSVADVVAIRDLVPEAINMSAGYHSPHTNGEIINVNHVERIKDWIKAFITESEYKVV